jgi:hypothetical protein
MTPTKVMTMIVVMLAAMMMMMLMMMMMIHDVLMFCFIITWLIVISITIFPIIDLQMFYPNNWNLPVGQTN